MGMPDKQYFEWPGEWDNTVYGPPPPRSSRTELNRKEQLVNQIKKEREMKIVLVSQ